MSVIDDFCDSFRNFIPYYLTIILAIFITIAPIDPIKAAQDFTAYRLQQIDVQGVKVGSRSSVINFETQANTLKIRGRKCLFLKLMEVSAASIKVAISQNAGAIIVLLPPKSNWDNEIRAHISNLEFEMMREEYSVPVYFAFENNNTRNIYENIKKLDESSSSVAVAQILMNSIVSHGYQFSTGYQESKPLADSHVINLFGKLSGNGIEEQLPTILIVAHYDSAGIAPKLSFGYDSNGSGVVVLLQIMRMFSKLYSSPKTQGKYNIAFLLSGGGKLNYIGTKKWLEDIQEHSDFISPDKIATVLCLESLGNSNNNKTAVSQLYAHVSRPPKNNTVSYKFLSASPRSNIQLVHKKINLNDDELHGEHERFSLKKIPAMTLSSSMLPKHTILDDSVSSDILLENSRHIISSLARLIYDLDGENALETDKNLISSLLMTKESIEADIRFITKYPRNSQLLSSYSSKTSPRTSNSNQNSNLNNNHGNGASSSGSIGVTMSGSHPLIVGLEKEIRQYLQHVKIGKVKPDPRDPEFVLYSQTEVKVMAHKVKPAIFDFLITCFVLGYLGIVFLIINKFSFISKLILQISMGHSIINSHGSSNGVDKSKKHF